MPTYYDNNKIIPSPFVVVDKTYSRLQSGAKLGAKYTITVNGTLVAYKGSPLSDESFHTGAGYPADETDVLEDSNERLDSILRKQEALRSLFSVDGRTFEVQPWNGDAPLKCYPRVQSIQFGEGKWYDLSKYTIVLVAEELYGTGIVDESFDEFITQASEQWTIQEGSDETVFNLTHSVSAQGSDTYDETGLIREAWENAQLYVQALLGLDASKVESSGALNLSGLTGYNHARVETQDEKQGSYSVQESWILTSTAGVTEDFQVNVNSSNADGLNAVDINGTITGLNTKDSDFQITTDRFSAASGYYESIKGDFLTRAQESSNITLNAVPVTERVGRNFTAGTIQYATAYNDRPSNVLSDSLSEQISVTDNFQADVMASIAIIGRSAGPILQNLNTVTERSRSLAATVVFAASGAYGDPPDIQDIIDLVEPVASQVFKTQDSQTWDYRTGILNRNISWVFSPNG